VQNRLSFRHVRSEYNRRRLAVLTTKICSNIRLFTISAAPNAHAVSIKKESPPLATILAVHRVRANAEETTVPDMGA
jgi:hypothetical protein